MVKKKANLQEAASENRPNATIEVPGKIDLHTNLAEIKKNDGVVGYILKDKNSATVDLNEPAKISDCAIFSSTARETANEVSEILGLGEVKRIVIKGKLMKILMLDKSESEVSVLMEKNADADRVCERL